MLSGLRVCGRGMRHLNHYGYRYVWANLAWLALSVPIVTAPAAWLALTALSRRLYAGETVGVADLWTAFRAHFLRGLLLGVINVALLGVNLSNLLAYRFDSSLGVGAMRWVWAGTILIWLALQFYAYPLYFEGRTRSMPGAFRNAAVMLARNPLFSLGLWTGVIGIVVLSTLLVAAWGLLTGALLVSIGVAAVQNRLETAGLRAPLPDPTSAPDSADFDATG